MYLRETTKPKVKVDNQAKILFSWYKAMDEEH